MPFGTELAVVSAVQFDFKYPFASDVLATRRGHRSIRGHGVNARAALVLRDKFDSVLQRGLSTATFASDPLCQMCASLTWAAALSSPPTGGEGCAFRGVPLPNQVCKAGWDPRAIRRGTRLGSWYVRGGVCARRGLFKSPFGTHA
eukprot:1311963-Amphidinium_carterae.1